MRELERQRLLVKAARFYYEEGLNQAAIAERLELSRQKVQRILNEALDEGIVKIQISPILGLYTDLERELERRFGLLEAVVVETVWTGRENQAMIAREVGAGAAGYLLRCLGQVETVAVSVGSSLLAMVDALPRRKAAPASGLTVVQAIGGLGDPNHETHATQLVTRAALGLRAAAMSLPAPAVAGTRDARRAFASDPYVVRTLERARAADLLFVGVGPSDPSAVALPAFWNVMTPATMEALRRQGAAGSINLRYFDDQGRAIASDLDEKIVGLTLDEIRQVRRVVGVAGGPSKVRGIRAALASGLVHVLVTDHVTAAALVEGAAAQQRAGR